MNKAAMLIGQKALKKLGNDQDKKHRAPNSDVRATPRSWNNSRCVAWMLTL